MKVLCFGANGQVARELVRHCPPTIQLTTLSRDVVDLQNTAAISTAIENDEWDAVINAAAYTAVDAAQIHRDDANTVNAIAPGVMALACQQKDIPFLHISSEFVFNGEGNEPYLTDSPTGPINVYGETKLAGEHRIFESGARAMILRTSWVFSAHGSNLVKTVLKLIEDRNELTFVDDQIGGPTPAGHLAKALFAACAKMLEGHKGGLFHYAGSPSVSKAAFVEKIIGMAGSDCVVKPITTSEFPTPAQRPLNSRLDCTSVIREFNVAPCDWEEGLAKVLNELGRLKTHA